MSTSKLRNKEVDNKSQEFTMNKGIVEPKRADLKPVKFINDPVYGGIAITNLELEIINTPIFQRLRGLRQLGRVNYVFPAAEHSRFVHSIGVLHIMGLMVEHLLKRGEIKEEDAIKMRVAALVHDIGHYPLSHLGESVYGYIKDNKLAGDIISEGISTDNKEPLYTLTSSHSKSAHHEQLGKYIITNNEDLLRIFNNYNLDPYEIGEIFTGEIGSRNMLYSQLLHSSFDADRLDYLLRDSYQTGVKYGLVDLEYLIRLLMVVKDPKLKVNDNVLVCNKKGQHVVEHFLMCRYFHYSQVIFHKTNAAFEGMIKAMYIKLIMNKSFMYNSLEEIHKNVNSNEFLNFNDASLEMAFKEFYDRTTDEEYKLLYRMYIERKRPKVIMEIKDLYEENPKAEVSILKSILKNDPDKISDIVGNKLWGYQIAPIKIETIHSHYTLSEGSKDHDEELREAIKLYDLNTSEISYLAEDKLSIINRLSNYKSEFIRIYVLNENNNGDYNKMRKEIINLISS